jgi:hypothetical protein
MGNVWCCAADEDVSERAMLVYEEPVDVWYTPGVDGMPGVYTVVPRPK